MRHNLYILGYTFYLCGTYLTCVGLSGWPSFVNAAEPTFAGSGPRRLAASPNSDGAWSGGGGEACTDEARRREEAAAPVGAAASLPALEAAEGPSSSVNTGVAAPEVASPYATLRPRWCTGEGIPLLQLQNFDSPLPSFTEVIQPQCSEWMTAADRRGRDEVLKLARRATRRQAQNSEKGEAGASLMHRVLPPGSAFSVDVLEAPGGGHFQCATFRCGHVVANGSFGIVMMVRRVTSPASRRAERAPNSAEQGHTQGAAELTDSLQLSRDADCGTLAKRLDDTIQVSSKKLAARIGGSAHAVVEKKATFSAGNSGKTVVADRTQRSLTKADLSPASSPASLHSSATSGKGLDTKAIKERGSSLGKPSATVDVAFAASGAACTAVPETRGNEPQTSFVLELVSNLVHGTELEGVFAVKLGLLESGSAPRDRLERERGAKTLIRERFWKVRRIWHNLPAGFTPQQLNNYGLVVPIATVQLRGMPSYLAGDTDMGMHLINIMEIMKPQLTDLYDVAVTGQEAQLYLAKRLIQLGAHLVAANLVHMDFKVENIGVSPSGELTLLDFDYVLREGDKFECRRKPSPYVAAPEICREALLSKRMTQNRECTALRSVDSWDIGITMFEAVCHHNAFFPCYYPESSQREKMECIASLEPPLTSDLSDDGLSSTRAPLLWGACNPSKQVKAIIYSLLDLDPEKRLDLLKAFVFGDLFRSPQN